VADVPLNCDMIISDGLTTRFRFPADRRSRGCSGYTCTPRVEKNFLGVIYTGKICKCTPSTPSEPLRQSKSQFLGHFLLYVYGKVSELQLVVFDCPLKATTKKAVNILGKTMQPQTKSWLCLCNNNYNKGSRRRVSALKKYCQTEHGLCRTCSDRK